MSLLVAIILLFYPLLMDALTAPANVIQGRPSTFSNSIRIDPSDKNVILEGRHHILQNGGRQFDAPGFRIHVGIIGATKIDMKLRANDFENANRFWVIVDGVLSPNVIDTFGASRDQISNFLVVENLSTEYHYITIVKITEANFNRPNWTSSENFLTFFGFEIDYGSSATLPNSVLALQARRIEFIGDSITAGYCNMCEDTSGLYVRANYQSESFMLAWPYVTASSLNASYHVSAWSGYGFVKGIGWMPSVFARTLSSVPKEDWSMSSWIPQAVVINLGTNDRLTFSGNRPVDAQFKEIYSTFIKNLTAAYGPETHFFLACGPMAQVYCGHVHAIIADLSQKSVKLTFLDQGGVPNNCCNHPGATSSQKIAAVTSKIISNTLNWPIL